MHRDEGGQIGGVRRRLPPTLLGLLAATALVAAGCGDDDAAPPAGSAPAKAPRVAEGAGAAPATTSAGATGFDKAKFCDAYLDANMAGAAAGDPDADPVASATALLEPSRRASALAPPELAADLAHSIDLLQQAIDTKDGSLIGQ